MLIYWPYGNCDIPRIEINCLQLQTRTKHNKAKIMRMIIGICFRNITIFITNPYNANYFFRNTNVFAYLSLIYTEMTQAP